MHPGLESIFSRLQVRCDHTIGVAGGAAVDFEKAGDVDVWFLRGIATAEATQARALDFLKAFPYNQLGTGVEAYATANQTSQVVGEAFDPTTGKVVQVLTSSYARFPSLLSRFDISTHMVAVSSKGTLSRIWATTDPIDLPRIVRVNRYTLARYIKICRRYGHEPSHKQLKRFQVLGHWVSIPRNHCL